MLVNDVCLLLPQIISITLAKKLHKNYANKKQIQSVAGGRWKGLETNMKTMFEFSGLICLRHLDISVILTDWIFWKVDSETAISVQEFYQRKSLEENSYEMER